MNRVLYDAHDRIARITLNRPETMNAIDHALPLELAAAVEEADRDPLVHVIVLSGAGEGFCRGYERDVLEAAPGQGGRPAAPRRDPMGDFVFAAREAECFMTLFRSPRPVLCKVHGCALGGGSDLALCSDLVVAAEDAVFGWPAARVWGSPTTAMWVHRLGPERAKRLLFTGDTVSGAEAERIGLIHSAVPAGRLDAEVEALAERIASVPQDQLMVQKTLVNHFLESTGLRGAQTLAAVFDSVSRRTADSESFRRRAQVVGRAGAPAERDLGPPGSVDDGALRRTAGRRSFP